MLRYLHHVDGTFDHKGYTEKAYARLLKAKAKAERAAARQAALGVPAPLQPTSVSTPPTASASGSRAVSPAPETEGEVQQLPEGEDASASAPNKESPPDRTELLRSKPEVVGRYMQLMVPILVDVYAASVSTPVRIKTLTGLLKAVSFLGADELKRVFTVCI